MLLKPISIVWLTIRWGKLSRVLGKSLRVGWSFIEEIREERVGVEGRHIAGLVRIEERLVWLIVCVSVRLCLWFLIFVLLWLGSSTWEGDLLQKVLSTPSFYEEFNSSSSSEEMFCVSMDQNMLLWNSVLFPLVLYVQHPLVSVEIVHSPVLDLFRLCRSLLILYWISIFVGDVTGTNSLFINVAFELYFDVLMDAEDFVETFEIASIKIYQTFSVGRFGL